MLKLSKKTIAVLHNFASINNNILLKQGNVIRTKSHPNADMIAEAIVEEEFPQDFPIYDLNKFLNALELFKDPILDFSNDFCTIKDEKNSLKYLASDMRVMNIPNYTNQLPKFKEAVSFSLNNDTLNSVKHAAKTLQLDDFAFTFSDQVSSIKVFDKNEKVFDSFETTLPKEKMLEQSEAIGVVFKKRVFNFLPGDVKATIGYKDTNPNFGIGRFELDGVTYIVSGETKAK